MRIDDLFAEQNSCQQNLLPCDGELYDYGFVLSTAQADQYFAGLLNTTEWQQDTAYIHQQWHVTERQIAWFGDSSFAYHYSGTTKIAKPWTPVILQLKQLVENQLKQRFNACLANLYHNGQQGMGWHSDDEPALGYATCIASLSFGSPRRFCFKHKHKPHKCELSLQHGQLVVMQGVTQHFWWHSIAKEVGISSPRINLTFRNIVPAQS